MKANLNASPLVTVVTVVAALSLAAGVVVDAGAGCCFA